MCVCTQYTTLTVGCTIVTLASLLLLIVILPALLVSRYSLRVNWGQADLAIELEVAHLLRRQLGKGGGPFSMY